MNAPVRSAGVSMTYWCVHQAEFHYQSFESAFFVVVVVITVLFILLFFFCLAVDHSRTFCKHNCTTVTKSESFRIICVTRKCFARLTSFTNEGLMI